MTMELAKLKNSRPNITCLQNFALRNLVNHKNSSQSGQIIKWTLSLGYGMPTSSNASMSTLETPESTITSHATMKKEMNNSTVNWKILSPLQKVLGHQTLIFFEKSTETTLLASIVVKVGTLMYQ